MRGRLGLVLMLVLAGCGVGPSPAPAVRDRPSVDPMSTDWNPAWLPATNVPGTAATTPTPTAVPEFGGLPAIVNDSGSSDEHVAALVHEAVAGLGFVAGDVQGPNPDDLVFVGRYYLAWLDQTGFSGEMNGLWRLNALLGDALDFVVRDGDRPVNFLIVGENGDGQWAAGYRGAEHLEFPSQTPEPDDPPSCASTDWCNQYALSEADVITDPDVPWWSACNAGSPEWAELREPVERVEFDGGLRVVWEGPLVKMADGDGSYDGDACHEDWLFADGVRRAVMLRVGYELYGDRPVVDRVMQFRNPLGNPSFGGPLSLIGGFVVTSWPDTHPLKQIDNFVRPELTTIDNGRYGISLPADEFTHIDFAALGPDIVMAWLDQPITLSVSDDYIAGRSATLSNVGPSDNASVGICLGRMHGAIELGGGLLHGGISLPIDGGETSIEARRRLELPGVDDGVPITQVARPEIEIGHQVGRSEQVSPLS